MDELLLRELTPAVIGVLVRRGVDFATAEDAVQEALVQAALTWPDRPPADPKGWLVTVAWRKFLDAHRSETSRRDREQRVEAEPPPGPAEDADDTLQLFFLCAHPSLTPASAVALTLRAVGGLTTRQIAQAYLVPEATMAQRISRAKRTVSDVRLRRARRPGDRAAGALPGLQRGLHRRRRPGGRGDPADPAVGVDDRRRGDRRAAGVDAAAPRPTPGADQARRQPGSAGRAGPIPVGHRARSPRGSTILQAALARDRLGEFQAQAAIAALHADAQTRRGDRLGADRRAGTTSCSGSPAARSSSSTGPSRSARPTAPGPASRRWPSVDPGLPRYAAASAYLHEKAGDLRVGGTAVRRRRPVRPQPRRT